MRVRLAALACTVTAFAALLAGFGAGWGMRGRNASDLSKVAEVLDVVRARYVEPQDPAKLSEAAIGGVLAALDPHSVYYSREEANEVRSDLAGHFGGVGIVITEDTDSPWIRVSVPMEGGPAIRAGVQPGDLITAVDGESIRGWKVEEARTRITGEPGTKVKLQIFRPPAGGAEGETCPTCGRRRTPETGETLEIELERAVITVRTVFPKMLDVERGIAYLRIRSFTETLHSEFLEGLAELQAQGARAYVIDLRFNGGGYLEGAVRIADLFLDSGPIVRQRGRTSEIVRSAEAGVVPGLAGAPVAVLVHEETASASEILAGALQEHGIARVFGARTFGKGTVQQIFPLRDGSEVKLTTAYYTLPSGRTVDRRANPDDFGVRPDVEVTLSPEDELKLLQRWEREKAAPQEDPGDVVDAPLDRAVEWIRERLP